MAAASPHKNWLNNIPDLGDILRPQAAASPPKNWLNNIPDLEKELERPQAAAGAGGGGIQVAFEAAVRRRDWPDVETLLKHGANPNIYMETKPGSGMMISPAWFALVPRMINSTSSDKSHINEDIVIKMLNHGLNPDTRFINIPNGVLLIERAVKDKHKNLVEKLIKLGAKTKIRTTQNKTLFQLSRESGNREIANMIRSSLPQVNDRVVAETSRTAYVVLGHGGYLMDAPQTVVPPQTQVVFNQECGLVTSGAERLYFQGENPELLNPGMYYGSLKKKFGNLIIVNEKEPLPEHTLNLFSFWKPGDWLPDKYGFSSSGIYKYPFLKEESLPIRQFRPNDTLSFVDIPRLYEFSIFPKKDTVSGFIDEFNKQFLEDLKTISQLNTERGYEILGYINNILGKNNLSEWVRKLVSDWRRWLSDRLANPDEPIGVLEIELTQEQEIEMLLNSLPNPGGPIDINPHILNIRDYLVGKPTIDDFFKRDYGFRKFLPSITINLSSFMERIKSGEIQPGVFYMPLCRYVSAEQLNAVRRELSGEGQLITRLYRKSNNPKNRLTQNLLTRRIAEAEFYKKRGVKEGSQTGGRRRRTHKNRR